MTWRNGRQGSSSSSLGSVEARGEFGSLERTIIEDRSGSEAWLSHKKLTWRNRCACNFAKLRNPAGLDGRLRRLPILILGLWVPPLHPVNAKF
jgi:hypothetical protein